PYAAFLALGLWPWNLFANAANRGVTALTDNAALIGKVAVPHALYVDARVAASVVLDMAGFAAVMAALLAFGVDLSLRGLPAALAGLAVVAIHAVAAARLLAVMQVFLRDIATLVGQLLVLGFFLTPVLYERSLLPGQAARWLAANPLVAPVETVRSALSGGTVGWPALGLSLLLGVGLLLLANTLLRRARSHLEDFL
ncbi:MAG: ABC transporter permease, partial [Arenimonas sp.]|nr:ABC transporter permease [Arenimonas sp.]